MINDFKKALQLSLYGFKAKVQMIFMIVFVIVGFVWEYFFQGMHWIGAYFIVLAPIYVSQLLYGMGMSNMVASSPYKKKLQVLYPALLNFFFELIAMTIIVLLKIFEIRSCPENKGGLMYVLLSVCMFCIVLNFYSAIVYKYFALSIVLMLVPVMGLSYIFTSESFNNYEGGLLSTLIDHMSLGVLVLICYLTVILGAVLQYAVSTALYKKPLSEYAIGMAMRKALKG